MNPEFCESSLGGDDEGNLLQPSVVEDLRSRQQRWHGIHRSRRDTQRRRKSKTTRNEREHKKLWRLSGLSSFTREELNHIRATTQQISFPNFLASPVELLDILVKGALTFAHAVKRRRRGKHAGAVCLCGLCTPLPGIFLSNVGSLPNKLDELQLLVQKNRDFSSFSLLCFMEKAVWIDSGLCAGSGWLQNGLRHRTVQQNKRQKLKEAVEQ
ncbi:uncharacterized protein [Trachinotus anak]|uniref:uncharacterized protein isoform X1 n=1 Tax=Trachinotus anak TaxID=443729 RepID=UPI0039F1B3D8